MQAVLNEALKLLRPSIPSTIEIQHRIDESCEKILADSTQIHQVIINLCTNAWQAMEDIGGTMTIELKQVKIAADFTKLHPTIIAGDYILFSVMDTGQGMDKLTMERIFEPFFTTKPVDKGTGLGLSVVHGIVHNHRGEILVESEPGKGSVFSIYLPVYEDAGEKTAEEKSRVLNKGRESILIVDDNDVIAELIKQMLEILGYQATACTSSMDALKVFCEEPQKFDLVITDLTMPKMTGLDLAEQMHSVRASCPVMIMTGYGDSLNDKTRNTYKIKQVLGKPVVLEELAIAVRAVLDN